MARLNRVEKKAVNTLLDMDIRQAIDSQYRHYRGKSFMNYLEQYYHDRFHSLLRVYKEKKEELIRKAILELLKEMESKKPDVAFFISRECRKKYEAVAKKLK